MTFGEELRREIDANPLWYHTLDLGEVVTPGWFDLRPIVDRLPWPDMRGKRCLDVGTYDGFLAFEMERRGAAEVVATDVASHDDWDWPPRQRAEGGPEALAATAGVKGRGFELAKEALGSKVERQFVNIYDLHPDRLGTFDVVVCGALLIHLRDPFRALDAIRSVCAGDFLSIEEIHPGLTVLQKGRPASRLLGRRGQWTVPNAAGHSAMLRIAGFDEIASTRPFAIPLGSSHPQSGRPWYRRQPAELFNQTVCRGRGIPVRAVRSHPGI